MIEGTTKREPKNDVCHFYCPKSFILEMVSTSKSKITRKEVDKTTTKG